MPYQCCLCAKFPREKDRRHQCDPQRRWWFGLCASSGRTGHHPTWPTAISANLEEKGIEICKAGDDSCLTWLHHRVAGVWCCFTDHICFIPQCDSSGVKRICKSLAGTCPRLSLLLFGNKIIVLCTHSGNLYRAIHFT